MVTRARIDELRRQLLQAESLDRQLASEGPQLDKQVASLKNELEEVRQWKQASFVLGDSTGTVAAAVRIDGDRFVVQGTAEGRKVPSRLSAAAKEQIVCVATKAGRDLARTLCRGCRPGDEIRDNALDELKSNVWKSHQLLPLADAADLKFVVFRDAQRRARQHIGVFSKVDGDSLYYQPLGRDVREIHRSRIEPGTLRADAGADILDAVDGDETFLDYCVLSVAHELSKIGRQPGHMAIGVRVELDGLGANLKDEGRYITQKIDTNDFFKRCGICFFDFAFEWSVFQEDRNAALKRIARGVEDSLYTKLHTSGFPVVELEHIESLRLLGGDQPVSKIGPALGATHLLVAEVGPAKRDGMYRLTMRLVDGYRGNALWAIDSEPTLPRHDSENPLFLKSGRLAAIRQVKDLPEEQNVPMLGIEKPALVPLARSNSIARTQLVLVEPGPPGEFFYRSLFGRQVYSLPERLVSLEEADPRMEPKYPKTVVARYIDQGVDEVADDAALDGQLTRAVIWAMASSSMTPAGRIVESLEGGHAFRITLGLQDGLRQDSVLRVLRTASTRDGREPDDGAGGERDDFPLPLTFKVRSLDAESSVVIPLRMGLEIDQAWNDGSLVPRVGDIVYNPHERVRKFAVFPPQDRLQDVAGKEFQRLSQSQRQKIMIDQENLAQAIRRKVATSFINLNAAFTDEGVYDEHPRTRVKTLNYPRTCEKVALKGATHVIGGFIKPDRATFQSNVKYDVELLVYELTQKANGLWDTTETKIQLPKLKLGPKVWE